MARPNIRTVNKLIDRDFPGYSLVQERDCVRLHGPDTHGWASTCFMVYRVSHQTPAEWVEDVRNAVARHATTF